METELTKTIKQRIPGWRPAFNSSMRTIRYAYEVWTPTGIVDVIRFEDAYIGGFEAQHYCKSEDLFRKCKIEGLAYPNENCLGCVWNGIRKIRGIEILTTCFEVKITVADFKSENGHNFHGNHNYYVVPVNICDKILPLVEDGIGVVVFYPESGHMVEKKKCERRKLDDSLLVRLLYDALKKWC